MDKMKAIVASGYGSPDVFQLKTIDRPQPKNNEVLVKIHASSATRADGMMRTGKPYVGRLFTGMRTPKYPIPGTGFAGIVESAGKDVRLFSPGEKVFGETTLGFSTNAEYVAVPENGVILSMPDNMDYAEAAMFCDGPLTSINYLREIGGIKAGQKVLINGASGSLGTAAVQLAKYFGAEVTAVTSIANVGLVKALGADHVVDYTRQDFTRTDERYDIIYDTVGKSSFGRSRRILVKGGLYLSPVLKFSLLMQMLRTSITGTKKAKFTASGLKPEKELRELLSELVGIFGAGKLKIVIDRKFPLEKIAAAHTYIDGGHKKGNVIIVVQP